MINRIVAKYKWFYYRLQAMNIKEILYRIRNIYSEKFYKVNSKRNLLDIGNEKILPKYFLPILNNNNEYSDDLSQFCFNRNIHILDVKIPLDNVIWNKDYSSGYIFENIHFSKIKFYNLENKELKYVLELNRLQFLIDLAYCYKTTKNKSYLEKTIGLIESWIDSNEIPYGLIWQSKFGTSFRLISWILVWQLIDFNNIQDEYKTFTKKWINSINNQLTLLTTFLSKYSSANNHLIGELVGIYICLIFFQKYIKNSDDLEYYKKMLEDEFIRQNYSDGVNKESAYGYLNQAHEWIFLYLYASRSLNILFNKNIEELFFKMSEFIFYSLDENYNFYDYGDRDDGSIIKIGTSDSYSAPMDNCNLAALYFDNKDLLIESHFNEKHELFFPKINIEDIKKTDKFGVKVFNESGHIIVSSKIEEKYNLHFHTKYGPFGFMHTAAHSHSDLNSFFLSIDGIPIFVDSGTYGYRQDANFRNYFQGSLAHNSISVNGLNQAKKYGSNHWLNNKKTYSNLLSINDNKKQIELILFLTTESYTHRRTFEISKQNFSILIIDEINSNKKDNYYEKTFHFHPDVDIIRNEQYIMKIRNKHVRLKIEFTEENVVIKRGETEPFIIGWYSNKFAFKEPTNCVYMKKDFKDKTITKTRIYFEEIIDNTKL